MNTNKELSPYEKVQLRMKEEQEEWKRSEQRAAQQRYHLIQLSIYRYNVVERVSHYQEIMGVEDVFGFKMVSEKPLKYNDACKLLKELREK